MMQEKWFVHFQGHTMGPFSTEQIKTSIQKNEIGKQDRIASSDKKTWQTVETIPEFNALLAATAAPFFSQPIPPPVFGKKTKAEEKKVPAAEKMEPKVEAKAEAKQIPEPKPLPTVTSVETAAPKIKSRITKKLKGKRPAPKKEAKASARSLPKNAQEKREERVEEKVEENLIAKEISRQWEENRLLFEKEKAASLPAEKIQPQPSPSAMSTAPSTETVKHIEIRLLVPELSKKQLLFISSAFAALVLMAALAIPYFSTKKGVEEFSTPPPPTSSPEEAPERNDPIPSLKPPTRPNRD